MNNRLICFGHVYGESIEYRISSIEPNSGIDKYRRNQVSNQHLIIVDMYDRTLNFDVDYLVTVAHCASSRQIIVDMYDRTLNFDVD